jgi:chromate reductase, NAD(P)H dehydrogenase (quinone)
MKICIVVGSEGKNLELARSFEECLKAKNATTVTLDIVKMNLPLYTSAIDKETAAIDLMGPYLPEIKSDGFVFLSPEYNGSTTPAFANFIAWVSRSTKSWREHFTNKVAVIGSFNGGGTNVLTVMRIQLAHLGVNVLGRSIHVTNVKPLDEKALNVVCDQLLQNCSSYRGGSDVRGT